MKAAGLKDEAFEEVVRSEMELKAMCAIRKGDEPAFYYGLPSFVDSVQKLRVHLFKPLLA